MRQSKFTETQIVSILKEADAGRPVNEIWRQLRHQLRHLLQMESQVRGAGGLRREAAEGTGAREQPAQADVCRSVPGECGAEGCHRKKALRPAERREVVTHLVTAGRPSGSAGLSRGGTRPGDVLSASRGLGTARCAGDRGADDARGGEESLGLLEMLRSAPARRAWLES